MSMTRVKRGYIARKRQKKILAFVSGSRGAHSKLFRTANQRKARALVSSHQRKKISILEMNETKRLQSNFFRRMKFCQLF
jgi:ribosomal protein L20